MIRSINESIKNDFIGGYRIPLKDQKSTDYDHEAQATMTFEEFESWLVNWIVDTYHQRSHGGLLKTEGIEISPSDRYEQGLSGTDGSGRTVGLPDQPLDKEKLRSDLLPFDTRTLGREGIQIFNLQYNSTIIMKIRGEHGTARKEYIIKYDSRDLREIYLWDDVEQEYHTIPLRNVYYLQLKIDPLNPDDYPLSLEELNALKSIRKTTNEFQ